MDVLTYGNASQKQCWMEKSASSNIVDSCQILEIQLEILYIERYQENQCHNRI